ncbi:MAG: methionyl-tRNA formyltransferase [Bacteroidota bacterium]
MRVAWVGFHREGIPALRGVLEAGHDVVGVLTLTAEQAGKRSASADYSALCDAHNVPLHPIRHVNDPGSLALLREMAPDVLFVIGWSQILAPEVLAVPSIGTVGAHASMLPHNRGSAPINWALIRGETEAGNSLMWLAPGVDTGDLIDQMAFPITPYDTCATLYDHVAETNRAMILRLLDRLAKGERPGRPQDHTDEPLLPRRRPADGLVDWSQPAPQVYDFIRALTRPYPGAFSHLGGQTYQIWKAALLPSAMAASGVPGEVLGPVVSPDPAACGIAVACGTGAVVLLELEDADRAPLAGPDLSEQPWTSLTWTPPPLPDA